MEDKKRSEQQRRDIRQEEIPDQAGNAPSAADREVFLSAAEPQLEEKPAKRAKKDDGIWGTLTMQGILAVLLALAYVAILQFSPQTADGVTALIREKERNDFSFRDSLYQTVSSVITYLNSLDRPESSFPDTEKSIPAEPEKPEMSGMGGDFTPAAGRKLPESCTMAPVIYTGAVLFPIASDRRITSLFGFRNHPINGKDEFHKGVDIAAPQGTNIRAAFGGTVAACDSDPELGNYIILDHGRSFFTLYAHCDRLIAREGMRVRQGETIAKVGSTGDSTGFHLHFAARLEGLWFNPAYLFPRELHAAV